MEEEFMDLGFLSNDQLADMIGADDEDNNPDTGTDPNEPDDDKQDPDPDNNNPDNQDDDNGRIQEPEPTDDKDQRSPISSSIALALMEAGGLETLDEDRIKNIKSAEDLIAALKEDQRNQLDERQKRIDEALEYNVQPSVIQQYENTLHTLNSITPEMLDGEEKENENYRRNLIYNHYLIKRFSEEEANEMVERSFASGNDVKDAKKALAACIEYYNNGYNNAIQTARQEAEDAKKEQKKQVEAIQTSILEDNDFFKQFEVSKPIRKKILDAVTKNDKDFDGKKVTALQKYIMTNPAEAYQKIGTLFVLTDGFTKMENLGKAPARREVRKHMKDLDNLLTNNSHIDDGSLTLKSGVSEHVDKIKMVDFDFEM